jgi:RNA polymerase sigma-70 factor (ECF subfamily)
MRHTNAAVSDPEGDAAHALSRGDRGRALDVLMAAYGKMIYSYCRRILVDSDLADDVLQTTFLQAFEDFERFDGRSSLRTWLFGISHHRCLDALKSRRRRQNRFESLEAVRQVADSAIGVEEAAASGERRFALTACLAQLDARVREAVLLRFELGFTYPEIADICNERAPTLQARVARALPVLRRCLQLKGVGL